MNAGAWSYSRWDTWHTCPLKYKLRFLDKLPTEQSAAMANGDRVHKNIAKHLQTNGAEPLTGFEHHKPFITELLSIDNKVVEQQWGFTRGWGQTGWFAKDVWVRTIIDVGVLYDDMTAEVLDWKTGKHRETHEDQLEIFAISLFARAKQVSHVTARMVYVDAGTQEISEYPRAVYDKLVAKWDREAMTMLHDESLLPRPNDTCKFCDFSRSKGGPCRYG